MKKILIVLVMLFTIITLSGCGSNDKKENINSEPNETVEITENEDNNDDYIYDDEIVEWDDSDNEPPVDETVVVEKVINCDGCVYAYFSKEGEEAIKIGDTLSEDEYTTDINNLKTMGGKQRHNFFGLVLSGNKISKAYACIYKDKKIYCIQGSTNGAYHSNNIAILNQIFTKDQCKTISAGHTYTCTDGDYNGDTITTGYTSLHYETSCTIYGSDSNTGKLICH